jgi:fluoride exporter
VNALLVALGGAIGAVARYGVTTAAIRIFGSSFPYGTMIVNVAGSFAIGLVIAFLLRKYPEHEAARLFLATGILGGFTTFSAFSMDVMNLLQRGEPGSAFAYIVGSVVLSIAAVFAGFALIRMAT